MAYGFTCAIKLGDRFLAANRESLANGLDHIEDALENMISKPAPSQPSSGSNEEPGLLQKLLSHPLTKMLLDCNPLDWIMEAFAEGLGESGLLDEIVIPKLPGINTGAQAFSYITTQLGKIYDLFLRIIQNLQVVITNPAKAKDALMDTLRSVVWTTWEGIKGLILQLFDMVATFFHDVGEFLLGEWKLPPLTEIWEDLTGLKFTLVNVFTYAMANFLGVITIASETPLLRAEDLKFLDPERISDASLKIFDIPPRHAKAENASDGDFASADVPAWTTKDGPPAESGSSELTISFAAGTAWSGDLPKAKAAPNKKLLYVRPLRTFFLTASRYSELTCCDISSSKPSFELLKDFPAAAQSWFNTPAATSSPKANPKTPLPKNKRRWTNLKKSTANSKPTKRGPNISKH